MIAPRWRKVLRDIGGTPVRTALAVAAMASGTFGVGAVLTSYSILARELASTYSRTRPASAIVGVDKSDDALIDQVRRMPEVFDAEARPIISGRIRVGKDEWAPLVLFVIRDFRDLRMDRFTHEAGAWPPAENEMLLERTALSVARAGVGDTVTVRAGHGAERSLRISGTVHAGGLAPSWMDHVVSGFVSWRSVTRSDPSAESAQLRIVVTGNRLDEDHIRAVAERARVDIEKRGHVVRWVEVPPPGRHPHADQMETFLFLLGAFGALTFALSAVLVANMIHALLTEQVRQVGIMKTIGATTAQVAALYLGQVAILAAVALAVGMVLGYSVGRGYAGFSATILNADLSSRAVPLWVVAVQIGVGMLVPLMASLVPVYRASRMTIHEAFSADAGRRLFGSRPFDRLLARVRWLPRPMMLSLRTTFDRRGRLMLTVGTLALGGAVFISALNVRAAWNRTLAADAEARHYDIQARLSGPYDIQSIDAAVATLPDVVRAEYWPDTAAILVGGKSFHDGTVAVLGPDWNTKLLDLPLLRGRRLRADDQNAVVVNQGLLAVAPAGVTLGSNVLLRIKGRDVSWRIVGVVKEMAPMPVVYASPQAIMAATEDRAGTRRTVRIVTRRHDAAAQLSMARDLERALQRRGIGVAGVQRLLDTRKAFADHLIIIESVLVFASALVIFVGALGLATTLTLNVLQRTREIGILGAIGATPRTISRSVMFEGIVMGVLSWVLALVVAVPATAILDAVAGQIFIKTALDFFMSPSAAGTWLLLVVILAALSSFYPARRSARLTVREALAHE